MATLLTIVPTPRFPSPRALLPRFLALEATVAVLPPQGPRSVSLMSPTGRAGPLGNVFVVLAPPRSHAFLTKRKNGITAPLRPLPPIYLLLWSVQRSLAPRRIRSGLKETPSVLGLSRKRVVSGLPTQNSVVGVCVM